MKSKVGLCLLGAVFAVAIMSPAKAGKTDEFPESVGFVQDPGIISVPDGEVGPVSQPLQFDVAITEVEPAVATNTDSAEVAAGLMCELRSDYPHRSSTEPGYVHARGASSCTGWMPYLYESGLLWRPRWYGPQDLGYTNEDCGGCRSNRSINRYHCRGDGTHTYVIENYHYGRWPSGGDYRRRTANENRFSC